MSVIFEYILATRPWSFTAAIVPVLITVAVIKANFYSIEFLRIFIIAIAVQAGANLSNTYYDFINGVDSKVVPGGDNTLVDKKVSKEGVIILSILCYLTSVIVAYPILQLPSKSQVLPVFVFGLLLAFFYTATPVSLKYHGLGDVTIFLCFGPLLMQCSCLILTGEMNNSLYLYSLPIGLITENILHANNIRDIKADSAAGIKTLAMLLDFENSCTLYSVFFLTSYLSAIYISLVHHWGCVLSLLTIPLALSLIATCQSKKLSGLPEETAKMHSLFGLLLFLGIYFTEGGALSLIR